VRHPCPAPSCPERVTENLLACRAHWAQLPAPLRVEVNDAWQERQKTGETGRHYAAVAEAVRYWLAR
jgi:hypothetical protein